MSISRESTAFAGLSHARFAQGVFLSADGDEYRGGVAHSRPDGYGVFTYANGNRYGGHWVHGQRHGQGEMVYYSGTSYCGEVRRAVPCCLLVGVSWCVRVYAGMGGSSLRLFVVVVVFFLADLVCSG